MGQNKSGNPQRRNFMMQHTAAPNKWASWRAAQCNIVCEEHEHSTKLPGFTPWWLNNPCCMLSRSGLLIMLFHCWGGICLDSYFWTFSEDVEKAAGPSECFSSRTSLHYQSELRPRCELHKKQNSKRQETKYKMSVHGEEWSASPLDQCREWTLIFRGLTVLQRRRRP